MAAAKKTVEPGSIFDQIDGREVAYVKLHQAAQVPGIINGERTLTAKKIVGLEMKFDGRILYWKRKDKEGFIPAAAISDGLFA